MPDVEHAVPCATCGCPVDAARAVAVRLTSVAAHCFCSQEHCDQFVLQRRVQPDGRPRGQARSEASRRTDSRAFIATTTLRPSGDEPMGARLRPVLISSGSIGSLERRAQPAFAYQVPRAFSWSGTCLALVGAGLATASGVTDPLPELALLVLLLAALAVFGERAGKLSAASSERACRDMAQAVSGTARVMHDEVATPTPADHVRPGEELEVSAGETLLVDGSVLSGTAEVWEWEGAEQAVPVGEGVRLCAGARVLRGDLRFICTASGADRTVAGLVRPGSARLDRAIASSRLPARIALFGGPASGAAAALSAVALGAPSYQVVAVTAAALGAVCSPLLPSLAQATARRWLVSAAREGIFYRSATAVDQAAAVSTAVFCSRGTVLHGEPEVTEIHALREENEERVLALAAGAASVIEHPVATSVLRAAHDRGVSSDASRSHQTSPGMGVVCVSARGEPLVVGSRELLLRERISIARAEEVLRNLESKGRTGLLVAEAGHLVGIISLHDGFRPGAKASVQLLLDAGIEPVLLSGEARQTVEAVARALAIEHVRPEIPANQRAGEIRNLEASGALVATIGTSPRDDGALSAAHVPVIIDGATLGSRLEGITVIPPRTVTAAKSLIFPKAIRQHTLTLLVAGYAPTALGCLATMSLLVPALSAPLLVLVGHAAAFFWHARAEKSHNAR